MQLAIGWRIGPAKKKGSKLHCSAPGEIEEESQEASGASSSQAKKHCCDPL